MQSDMLIHEGKKKTSGVMVTATSLSQPVTSKQNTIYI